jgi:hypothetical protein
MDLVAADSLQMSMLFFLRLIRSCVFWCPQLALDSAGKLMACCTRTPCIGLCQLFAFACLQIALDNAGKLMDLVAAGEGSSSYAAIAQQLAEEYQKAGLSDVANFIKATS